jgi:hypothetical protein
MWKVIAMRLLPSTNKTPVGQASWPARAGREARAAMIFFVALLAGAQSIDEYAAKHKYLGNDRQEYTYTITSVLQLAKPYNLADMTDDYQDARLISEDANSATVEVVYYPLNTNRFAIGENPNWRRDYAGMTQYLRPTPTENWDEKMRADLLTALRNDGIDPDQLTDRQLVTEVSRWLMKRSRTTNAFAIWFVHYPNGVPEVFPALRKAFDKEKPSPDWTDQKMFDQEVLGRSMFYNKVHGSCTSTATLMATVMRALGIPTRIVYCVPPIDGNDLKQREMLLSALHHNRVRGTIRHGLPEGHGSFTNHLFNEVFVGNRWVRLNYDVVGQNNLDDTYFGLLTHILTTDSLSHVPIAETWGVRYANYDQTEPKLSSINPYRLLKVSDHFGTHANIPNPEVEDEELRNVTVTAIYRTDMPPAELKRSFEKGPLDKTDFFLRIDEFIPHYRMQLPDFARKAGREFILSAPGHPEVHARLNGWTMTQGTETNHYQLLAVRVNPEERQLVAAGVTYAIHPVNTNQTYSWNVKEGIVWEGK